MKKPPSHPGGSDATARRSGDQAFPHLGRCGFGATIATRSTDARKKHVDKMPNALVVRQSRHIGVAWYWG
jgi:hypothetical protein